MYLTAFLHRDKLYEITNRWLSDGLHAEDPLEITKIITYDSFAAWEMLLSFVDTLLPLISDGEIDRKKIADKKELKDLICDAPFRRSKRVRTLIRKYRQMPEFYYIGSPLAGYVYQPFDRLAGSCGSFDVDVSRYGQVDLNVGDLAADVDSRHNVAMGPGASLGSLSGRFH